MVLHIGGDVFVSLRDIVAVLRVKAGEENEFLAENEARGQVIRLEEKIKSAVVVRRGERETVYYSPISAATLLKRANHIGGFERTEEV